MAFNRNVDEAYLSTYEEYVDVIPDNLFKEVVDRMIMKNKFMPTVNELLGEAYDLYCEYAEIHPLSPEELLKLFKRRISRGSAKEAFKDDIELLSVAEKFGWDRFKKSNPAYDNQIQKELYTYYKEALDMKKINSIHNFKLFIETHPAINNRDVKMIGDS